MADGDFTSWPDITIGGGALGEALHCQLAGVVVDLHMHLPDMVVLRFHEDADALKKGGLHIGATVSVTARGLGETSSSELITAEITAIEAEYTELVSETVVRGYDRSHRLQHGRRTQTFKQEKISDVVRSMAAKAGLAVGTIDDTGGALTVVSQHNLSDWEFLRAHARELGFEVSVAEGKLNFRRPTRASTAPGAGNAHSGNPRQLAFGSDLIQFRPRISGAQQVKRVQVRAWDPARKEVMIGSAPVGADHAQLSTTPAGLAGTFEGDTHLVHDRPLSSQTEVDRVAGAIAEQIGTAFVEAQGVSLGHPELQAGVSVHVSGVAEQFAGRYTLTQARHVFDEDGYRTHFAVSGRQERSLLGLTSIGASNGHASGGGPPISGTVIATVSQNADPDSLGRVKLRFPWLSETYESDWSRVVQVGAGPDSGVMFLPEVGDEVLCAFEFGDMRRPYVIGGLHNGKDKPRLGDGLVDAGKVTRRGVVSRSGHRVVLFDGQKSGIALISADGKLRISLNQTRGEIHITGDGPMTIDAGKGAVTVRSQGDVTVQAGGNLSLKGQAGVKIESDAVVEISGKLIKLN
ncbi:MAG TPA: VgrG-related protein [Candidatus Dormibacteraeota bacterium]